MPVVDMLEAKLIADPANELFVSVASLWEIAIKYALARGKPNDMPISPREAPGYLLGAGYVLLDIAPSHVVAIEGLPMLHSDPFDRILIAQALTEPLRLLTHDGRMARYSDTVIMVRLLRRRPSRPVTPVEHPMELFIFARFHARNGQQDAVAAALRDVLPPTRAEPGCCAIGAYRSSRDPLLFHIHSRWADEAAFDRHAEQPHTVRFLEHVQPLIDHPLDVTRCQPIG